MERNKRKKERKKKKENLPFQGTGSSKDMAAVMKGIELDTFVRTHI